MRNITINTTKNVIEISKSFEKKASAVGTSEYELLQRARKDYPDMKVVVKIVSKKKKDNFKGLTIKKMEDYIAKHDDENKSIMAEFNDLRATSEEAQEKGASASSYGEIKTWFLAQFPEIEAFTAKREEALEIAKETRRARKIA